MKSFRKLLHKKTPVAGELFIIGVLVFASIGGYVVYIIIDTNNHKEQNAKTAVEQMLTLAPTDKVNVNTPTTTNNNISPSNSSQSTKATQSLSASAPSSDPSYSPYDINGSPKDVYGCVLPPTNVSNLKLEEVYKSGYAGCVSMAKPSWCFVQAASAFNIYDPAKRQAETIYDEAKAQDEAYIQKGQALGGPAGQQMVSAGNSWLIDAQATYRTAYNAAYDAYSNAIVLANQQGNCNNSIPTYEAPTY